MMLWKLHLSSERDFDFCDQLLGTVLLTSKENLCLKAVDISSERENYIEKILEDLKKKEITVCAIVTDSTLIAHQHMQQLDMMSIRISNRSVVFLPNINYYLTIEPPVVESRRQAGEELPLPT
ncbi:hypothetical protein RclHR1_24060005 [Rhizophagus clarus]|uniref:Uncharacterized protein n=1 Tax=Rhizophagus clarus TaxID=94130 RepID=A0A2Z6RRC2_9GLOM|nr:hypothetical protein RclHR1_24060005 [Rhizophagus clarus]